MTVIESHWFFKMLKSVDIKTEEEKPTTTPMVHFSNKHLVCVLQAEATDYRSEKNDLRSAA